MTREIYHAKLEELESTTLDLGRLVATTIVQAAEAMAAHDTEKSEEIIARDRQVNLERLQLERAGLLLIATQHPVAGDMRTLAALQEMVGEIERMGDYAKGIASITLKMDVGEPIPPVQQRLLVAMAEKAREMLRISLDAFEQRDTDMACAVIPMDDEVDDMFAQVYQNVVSAEISDSTDFQRANYVLWAAHNLERTADRVINMCESVVYVVTGELVHGRKMTERTARSSPHG
jgi:phosphate transport system protein